MRILSLLTLVITIGFFNFPEAEASIFSIIGSIGSEIQEIFDALGDVLKVLDYITESINSVVTEFTNPPNNKNSSVQYLLYTREHNDTPCYLEPNATYFKACDFDPSYPVKFIVHGFNNDLPSGNYYEMLKDALLQWDEYNVILVNWEKYSNPPYVLAALNTQFIGRELAQFIFFMKNETGIDPTTIHLIGSTLGAHLSGVAGKYTHNLGRITGLDPSATLFSSDSLFDGLKYTDANFVDVIHTSNDDYGYSLSEALGYLDFYPNGGQDQSQCGNSTGLFSGADTRTCNHLAAIQYFMESINDTKCHFYSLLCDNYPDFLNGLCSPKFEAKAVMGFHAQTILGLAPKSKFFLRTNTTSPYCLQNGYKPLTGS